MVIHGVSILGAWRVLDARVRDAGVKSMRDVRERDFHSAPLLCTAAQCRALDQSGARALGIATYELMARAGRASLELLLQAWPRARATSAMSTAT